MRKLTILLAVAAVAASSTGCCGRIRNWFHKGSPCGTALAPAMLGAPVAMAGPIMSAPMATSTAVCEPACCVPCDPCGDPCGTSVSSGYFGGYVGDGGADCGCADGGATMVPSAAVQSGGISYPAPIPEN